MSAIDEPHCRKVGTSLRNRAPGLALAMRALRPKLEALEESFPKDAIVLACLVNRRLGELRRRRCTGECRAQKTRHLLAVWAYLEANFAAQAEDLLAAVETVLTHHHRASSVTEGFLELFGAHYNLRSRRWGRHKGTAAHQCLTGQRVGDWLSVLGFPPSGTVH